MSKLTQFTVTGKEKDDFYGFHRIPPSKTVHRTVTKREGTLAEQNDGKVTTSSKKEFGYSKFSIEKITFNKVETGAVSYTVYELLFVAIEKQFNPLVFYTPPDFTVNLQVLYEVFII